MGEFLLMILKLDADGRLIYAKKMKYSKYTVGQLVPIYYPHKSTNGLKAKPYYRIHNRAFSPARIHALLEARDPNVFDRDGYTKHQRELRDTEIFNMVAEGADMYHVAKKLEWIEPAVQAAIYRHNVRAQERRAAAQRAPIDVAAVWDKYEREAMDSQ